MTTEKWTVIALGMAVVVVALVPGVWGPRDTARPAAAQVDRCELLQQLADDLSQGQANLENWAEDMVFQATPICDDVECVGRDAYQSYLQYLIDVNTQLTITSCEVSGDTVAVTNEVAMDPVRAAGVDRIIGYVTYEFEGDALVSSRQTGFDFTDPQTSQYVAYARARPRPMFGMGPGRDADQSPGNVEMYEYPDFVGVFVRITPGPSGVLQPIDIHEGTCANLGDVAFPLRDVDGGVSHTILRGVALSDLQTGNSAIAVQRPEDEPDLFVACGDIPAAVAAEAPPEVVAPAAELPPAGSGGFLGEDGGGIPNRWYALAAGGVLLIISALAAQRIVRRRR
jgi:hypothetical protein